jgi:two-component system sensor histidine kinase UhpB
MEKGTSVRSDLVLVAGLTLAVAIVSVQFELSEAVQSWTRNWEHYQLDELPGVLFFTAVAMAWFAWRRIHEARAELLRRIALERELAAALRENRRLVQAQMQIQEEERRRLARELHDELGQHLNAIKIDAVTIRSSADTDVRRAARSIVDLADHLHAIVRDMTRRLRPAGLDELGLPAALENCLESWRGRVPNLDLELSMNGDLDGLGEALNMTLYRLIQEGLTNVSRHAHARRVDIRLQRGAARGENGEIELTLNDDGRGFEAATWNGEGVGLIGMRERVEALGGRLEIATRAAHGFSVRAWLPVASSTA